MRGYELVLYANAALLLMLGFLTLTYGVMITRQADLCADVEPACTAPAALGGRALAVAPWLATLGTLLAGFAAVTTYRRLRRARQGPDHPQPLGDPRS